MDTKGRRLGQRMAAEIRAEMARQDRSGRWLAEQIGESHVTVGRWVKGKSPMGLDALDAICRALGLTIPDLLAAVERNGGYEPTAVTPRTGPAGDQYPTDTDRGSGRNTHGCSTLLAA
jgi:DNA-binding Xre family transcriptional regulator